MRALEDDCSLPKKQPGWAFPLRSTFFDVKQETANRSNIDIYKNNKNLMNVNGTGNNEQRAGGHLTGYVKAIFTFFASTQVHVT